MAAPGTGDQGDIALLSELLSLPNAAAGLNLSPARKREKLFDAILGLLEAEARKRPVLMVFEDVHWIDPTSRELLDLTIDRIRQLPVLLLITFRPEFHSPWGGRAHVSSVMLNRLGGREGETMVRALAGNAGLSPEIIAEIVERTDGVPLFVEELTKAVLESAGQSQAVLAAAPAAAHAVPATLHAALMARLDRLGPTAKEIAEIGAVLGREFVYELIEAVARRPESDLRTALQSTRRRGIAVLPGDAAARVVHVQTCPGAGRRLRHVVAGTAAGTPQSRRGGAGAAFRRTSPSASRNFWPIIAPALAKPNRRWRSG